MFALQLLPAITLGVVFADLTSELLGVGGIYENYNAEKCVPLLHDPVTDVTRAIVFDRCAACVTWQLLRSCTSFPIGTMELLAQFL